jgi:phytoene dehydrogenase-like protein
MTPASKYDAIVIGGGHNGLTAAALLAKAGRKVLLLEKRATLGGGASTEELFPGFHFNTGAPDARLLSPKLIHQLELDKHGLSFIESPMAAFAPFADGNSLTLWRDTERTAMELAQRSANDARAYWEFARQTQRFSGVLSQMAHLRPPNLNENSLGLLFAWARLALRVRGLGGKDMMEFLRVLPMSSAQWLNEHFETDALKGLFGAYAVTGVMQGPRASGTSFMLLYQLMGGLGAKTVRGGAGRVSAALAAAAQAHGAELRTGVGVAEILTESDAVRGVRLESGELVEASAVLSSADPRTTFLKLLGPAKLEPRIYRRLRSLKLRGSTATVHFALSAPPDFGVESERLAGGIIISPSLDYAERAYDDAKHGRVSAEPVLIARIPSLLDNSLAPAGKHAMSVTVRYAPYKLAESNWDAQREKLGDLVVETLGKYAPNLKSLISSRKVVTPLDYERDYGLAEGSEMHGQMGLDQLLLNRPAPGFVGYRSPVAGLYLCGAGAHPGGGLTGLPGMNAAQEMLREI